VSDDDSRHADTRSRAARADQAELLELRDQARLLDDEVANLRRKLADAPKRVRALEERLLETKGQLAQAVAQNEKLSYTLREAREHIAALRDEVDKLTRPPSAYGVVMGKNDDETIDIQSSGRKMRVNIHPDIELDELELGQEVVLNESFNVILARPPEVSGEVVSIKDVMEDGVRAIVIGRADEERVCELADAVRGIHLRAGDTMLMDARTGMLLERLPRPEVEDLLLEEVPDISYADIGGSTTRSSRSRTPSSCRSCTRSCSPSTGCRRRRGSSCTARRAAARR
jgi:proteasome-associated ATPase